MKNHAQLPPLHAPQCGTDLPASFGRIFAARRTKLGLSREDVAYETRIHARWIRLLEEGNVAGFGCITYARSFIRAYSAFLGVDPAAYLKALPERGVLGGESDYRYLTRSQGAWLRERETSLANGRSGGRETPRLRRIQSPVPAGMMVFVLMLVTTAIWAMHLTDSQQMTDSMTSRKPVTEETAFRDQTNAKVSMVGRDHRLFLER